MAKSSADRVRKYREKLKNDPVKAEEVRKKNLERIKSKKKKVSEMTEQEKNERRKLWREEKRKQRSQKYSKDLNTFTPSSSSNITITAISHAKTPNSNEVSVKYLNTVKRKCNYLRKNYQNSLKKNKVLSTSLVRYKKRLFRLQQSTSKKIKELETKINKLKAREEILEISLRRTYENCKKRVERRTIKKIIENSHFGNKTYVAKLIGLKRVTRLREIKNRQTCCNEIEEFWLKDYVSRSTAGKKECRSRGKEKHQIRYAVDTLTNLYKRYKEEGGRFGMTSLWKYKPYYVLSPHLNSRNTCLCIKHSNIDLKFKALKLYGILKQNEINDILKSLSCNMDSYECSSNNCVECKNNNVKYCDDSIDDSKTVNWWQWERVNHSYLKDGKMIKTKKTVKSLKTTSVAILKRTFDTEIVKFKKHVFIMRHQQKQYQNIINNLNDNEAVIICDFSENYDCKMREEVQALHFGASKTQVTLHTGAIFWNTNMQSFCTISDNNGHKPENIWSHLNLILEEIRSRTPNVTVLHFFSDGPTSQYRQKGNFQLLNCVPKYMGFKYCTWSFSESGHGKSIADGIGGSIKRTLDKRVSFGDDATNATQIYYVLTNTMKTVKIYLVKDDKIQQYLDNIKNLITLKGTMHLHQVITMNDEKIRYRDLSCFCGNKKGLCLCYSPQTHSLLDDKQISANVVANIENVSPSQCIDDIEDMDLLSDMDLLPDVLMNIRSPLSEYIDLTKDRSATNSSLILGDKQLKRKGDTLGCIKNIPVEPGIPKKLKSVQTLNCNMCHIAKVKSQMGKCMTCQLWYCISCIGGPIYIDFICDNCLLD